MRWTLRLDGATLPDRAMVGGKAWSIARMLSFGLPVPPAFVVTTEACRAYQEGAMPPGLEAEIDAGLEWLEEETRRTFGRGPSPLLLSVRSGAAISMPGMMDTVLNLGVGDAVEAALAAETGLPEFARDTHHRFLDLYRTIVLKGEDAPLPESPREQLIAAVRAVFDSWNSRRARKYRQHNGIDDAIGTAVTIQAMVFGNLDDASGTGVLFSRNPSTGERVPFGEYLARAQGEDVVSGKFTPQPLSAMQAQSPTAYEDLLRASEKLETEARDIQDIEFTVQRGKLWLLQSRSAKRAPLAAVRVAIEMTDEGLIDQTEAVARVTPEQIAEVLRPRLTADATDGLTPVATGEGACPGVASGVVVASSDEAERRGEAGEDVILVRQTTSPEDVHGMIAARAIVTAQGGATSHAAVVSRSLGRPCVVGCGDGVMALAGTVVTVDGDGTVWPGALAMEVPTIDDHPLLRRLADWARAAGDARFDRQPARQAAHG
ncbi:pyruvate, phosphate dikinase [Sphingomonas sp. SUN019]|uniref:pyruvate, phosphate dikinase n=1 Tax=Sphingomonas sp. SUN019 TaxID=2937788 RepID=UPI0021641081|nr:pyruvate, phosphate dikinase [Sphingomonas sp. SUN019]UVO52000.1 pyruvate, phosphate dikinase [Sphingomonas sp. SUN019]